MSFTLRGLPSFLTLKIDEQPVIFEQPMNIYAPVHPSGIDQFVGASDALTRVTESLNSPRWAWRFVQLYKASPDNVFTIHDHMVEKFIRDPHPHTRFDSNLTAAELLKRSLESPGFDSDNGEDSTAVRLGTASYFLVPHQGDMDGMMGFMPSDEAFYIHGTTEKLKDHLKKLSEILGMDFNEADFWSALTSLIKAQNAECEKALNIELSEETTADPYAFEWPINNNSPFQSITLKIGGMFVNQTGGISEPHEMLGIQIKIKPDQKAAAQKVLIKLFS